MARTLNVTILTLALTGSAFAETQIASLRTRERPRKRPASTPAPAATPRLPEPTEPALAPLRAALAAGQPPARAYADSAAAIHDDALRERAALVAAVAAFRASDSAGSRQLLTPDLLARTDFVGAYAAYLMGLLTRDADPAAAAAHFTSAYERAGNTQVRYRAALWLAEDASRRGDASGALALLDAVAGSPVDEALQCDHAVRRALLLTRVGRASEAQEALAELYFSSPLLGYRAATEGLYRALRAELGPAIASFPIERRVARAELLAKGGFEREAAREARGLLSGSRGATRDRVQLLIARGELARRAPRPALTALATIPRTSPVAAEARLLKAQALRRLGKERERENELLAVISDRDAGPARVTAAAALASKLEEKEPARAAAYWELVATESDDDAEADDATWKVGWLRYRAREYHDAAAWFGRLAGRSTEPRWMARATYWGARSMERAGLEADATTLYAEILAVEANGYYGMSALRRLRELSPAPAGATAALEAALPSPPPPPPDDPLAAPSAPIAEALLPARELLALGFAEDAMAELEYQARRFPDAAAPRVLLAQAHHDAGDHLESVRWLKRAFPDLERTGVPEVYAQRLYPLPYWDTIRKHAEAQGMDPYLAAAVIYQESRFRRDARSSAGAVGLMQLMPGTAREVARKLRDPGFTQRHLLEPERNIRYGVFYLRSLLDDLGGSPVRALAGYNAGSGRARRWSGMAGPDIDEYVEAIPFRETRNYVKNILVAHQGYHRVYDGAQACEITR